MAICMFPSMLPGSDQQFLSQIRFSFAELLLRSLVREQAGTWFQFSSVICEEFDPKFTVSELSASKCVFFLLCFRPFWFRLLGPCHMFSLVSSLLWKVVLTGVNLSQNPVLQSSGRIGSVFK